MHFTKIRRDKKIWVLLLGSLFLCWLFVMQYGIFGSDVDWISQHSVLPDYFRRRFYETGNFLPDIAWNLGGGQNIYNFSYYGLFNPVLMLSWLLPFVPMDCYIMVTSILCYASAVVLFYLWLEGKRLPDSIRFGTAVMFALAAPMIYHSYNQLMFVNYMPFLCLALIGTDKYFAAKKKGLLLCGVLGMILTSFYFSVGGIAALMLYALSLYCDICAQRTDGKIKGIRSSWKRMFRYMSGFVGCILHSILLAGVLLIPTACAILSGRQESISSGEKTLQLFSLPLSRMMYSPHGLGLSSLAIAALAGSIFFAQNWAKRILPMGLLAVFSVSAAAYLLNGGLYAKDKVFIPFLPLMCLQIAIYLTREGGISNKIKGLIPYIIAAVFVLTQRNSVGAGKYSILMELDCAAMGGLYLLRRKFPRIPWSLYVSCAFLFCYGWIMNFQMQRMIPVEEYKETRERQEEKTISEILEEDTDWYRFDQVGNGTDNKEDINRISDIHQNITSLYSSGYNGEYQAFRNQVFQLNEPFRNVMMQSATDNPCFLQFMGVRYLRSKKAPDGYKYDTGCENSGNAVYKNDSAAPLIYATDHVIGETSYYNMAFPQTQTVLLQRAVIPDSVLSQNQDITPDLTALPQMEPCTFSLPEMHTEDISITPCDGGYEIQAKQETEIEAAVSGLKSSDTMLALHFDVENKKPNKDMHIRVEGQTNRLTAENHEYANHNTDFAYMVTLPENENYPEKEDYPQTDDETASRTEKENRSGKGKTTVSVKLGAGKYRITNIRTFSGSMKELLFSGLYSHEFQVNTEKSGDDQIAGTVKTDKDMYLITSFPYDKNFSVTIDGKKVETIKVNTAFLGARVAAGNHEIIISYQAPGKTTGLWMSGVGIVLLIVRICSDLGYGGNVLIDLKVIAKLIS